MLVTVSCGMYLSAGVWAFVHGQDTRQDLTDEMGITAERYLSNPAYRDVWDSLHQQVLLNTAVQIHSVPEDYLPNAAHCIGRL